MKMFIWEDAEVMSGSKFNGTICAIAETVDDARLAVRAEFSCLPDLDVVAWGNTREEREAGMTDGWTTRQMLEKTLAVEPRTATVCLCRGGDY